MAKKGESDHIYGIHDRGGAHLLRGKGWVVQTEELGCDPNDWGSQSYKDLADAGLGVIVRLNHGYGDKGTIPVIESYPAFAARCGNFVQKSDGCHIWIIGNEPNLKCERPGGEVILPTMYANCFRLCRREIRSRPGHGDDQVVVAAVGPWNVETKPWMEYFTDVLWELNVNNVYGFQMDGIALHTYAANSWHPDSVTAESHMNAPFEAWRYGFRTYIDFMEAIPPWARRLPVYITECNQNQPWENPNIGWVQAAYAEVDRWNRGPGHQQIRCLALYRYEKYDAYGIRGLSGVADDLSMALEQGYTWGTQLEPKPTPPSPGITDEEWERAGVAYSLVPASMKDAAKHGDIFLKELHRDMYEKNVLYLAYDTAYGRAIVVKLDGQTWERIATRWL